MIAMMTAIRWLGLPGCALLGALLFYEGLGPFSQITPVLRIVPGLGPMVDDLAQGRVGRAYQRGQRDERIAWQERQRRAEIRRAAEQRARQAEIDAIERDYWQRDVERAVRMSALERALEVESNENPDDRCSGVPAIPGGLSRALDAIR